MTFVKYQSANNAQGVLHVPISSSATSLQLKSGQGDRFPSVFPYLLGVEQLDSLSAVIKREIVKVTNKSGDILTIVRSAGTCLPDDTSSTQGTQAFSFDADVTRVMQYIIAEQIKDIQDEVERIVDEDIAGLESSKLDVSEYQSGTYVYGATSGGTDSYSVTLPVSPGAYTIGQVFRFQADVGNTGSATLNINGLGAKTIKKLHDQDLETGDIEAGQIVVVAYDGTNFQMNSQVALIAEAETSKLTEKTFVVGEDGDSGDNLFVEESCAYAIATNVQNIGDVTSNTRVAIKAIGSGVASNTLKLALKKFVSPSANLKLRIESDNAGSPSGNLIDSNAEASIDPSSLTTSLADTTLLLAGSTTSNVHGVTLNTNETSQTAYKGVKFTLTSQVSCVSIDKISGCTATKAYLYDSTGILLKTATFSGNTAVINYGGLVNGSSYYILVGSDGSAYTSVKQSGSASFPYTASKLNYIGGGDKLPLSIDNSGASFGGRSSTSDYRGCKFTAKISGKIKKVNISGTYNSSYRLLSQTGSVLASGSFNADNITLDVDMVAGNYYRFEILASSNFPGILTFPSTTGTNIDYSGGSKDGADYGQGAFVVSIETEGAVTLDTDINNITSISTGGTSLINKGTPVRLILYVGTYGSEIINGTNYYGVGYGSNNTTTRFGKLRNGSAYGSVDNKFYYVSSSLFEAYLLSKTDSDYSYKIPNGPSRVAKANYTIGSIPSVSLPGSIINNITGITANTDIFLSGTPGKVSTTPGTNRYYVGKVLPDGVNVRQNSKNLAGSTQTAGASPYTYQNTLGQPIIMIITGGTVSAIAISRDGTNFFQVASATNGQVVLQPMDYVKITYSSTPTLTIFYQ